MILKMIDRYSKQKTLKIYGNKVPTDREVREVVLISKGEKEEEKIEALFNECDNVFYKYEGDLS